MCDKDKTNDHRSIDLTIHDRRKAPCVLCPGPFFSPFFNHSIPSIAPHRDSLFVDLSNRNSSFYPGLVHQRDTHTHRLSFLGFLNQNFFSPSRDASRSVSQSADRRALGDIHPSIMFATTMTTTTMTATPTMATTRRAATMPAACARPAARSATFTSAGRRELALARTRATTTARAAATVVRAAATEVCVPL